MFSIEIDGTKLVFEHSLVSLSKWEGKHKKPFFAWKEEDTKSQAEMLSYFQDMLISPENTSELVSKLTTEDHVALVEYINENRTATIIREQQQRPGPKENVTSELMYFWMVQFNIPFEAQEWHLSRLMTLVRICAVKNSKPEKRPASSIAAQYRDLNEQRRRELGTSG